MSRIGNKIIPIPKGVSVSVVDGTLSVKGPKNAHLTRPVVDMTRVIIDGNHVKVEREDDSKPARARHGLMRALLNNMITGV